MRTPNRANAWVLASSLALAASAALAQAPGPTPKAEPKTSPVPAPGASETTPAARVPSGGRNQFFSPVMPIEIKGEGLALPAGVAPSEEPIVKPSATPPATAK